MTSGRHNSAMTTNAENSRLNGPPTRRLVSIFTININSKSFSWAVRCIQVVHPPKVFMSKIMTTYVGKPSALQRYGDFWIWKTATASGVVEGNAIPPNDVRTRGNSDTVAFPHVYGDFLIWK